MTCITLINVNVSFFLVFRRNKVATGVPCLPRTDRWVIVNFGPPLKLPKKKPPIIGCRLNGKSCSHRYPYIYKTLWQPLADEKMSANFTSELRFGLPLLSSTKKLGLLDLETPQSYAYGSSQFDCNNCMSLTGRNFLFVINDSSVFLHRWCCSNATPQSVCFANGCLPQSQCTIFRAARV